MFCALSLYWHLKESVVSFFRRRWLDQLNKTGANHRIKLLMNRRAPFGVVRFLLRSSSAEAG